MDLVISTREFQTIAAVTISRAIFNAYRSKRDGKISHVVQEEDWGVDPASGSKSAARKDHDEKLLLVFDSGYEAYGYVAEAVDRNASPRKMENTATSFICVGALSHGLLIDFHGN